MTAHIIDDQDALLNYLYEEGDAAERLRIARHLQSCTACSVAVLELQSVRGMLADWTPPPVKLGFRIIQENADAKPQRRQWWQSSAHMPTWAQAAAAVLVFAAGMAVSQLDVQYGNGALTVRSRSVAPGAGVDSVGTVVPISTSAASNLPTRRDDIALPAEPSGNYDFAQLERQLRSDLGGRADADDILRRVRAMIDQSEARQQRELALRLADVVRDFDAQRRADLIQVQQNFGQLEGQTGQEVAHQRELLNYLVRTSGAR
jgi:hypothetical protein